MSPKPWNADVLLQDVNIDNDPGAPEQAAHEDLDTPIDKLLQVVQAYMDDQQPPPDLGKEIIYICETALHVSGRPLNTWTTTNPQGHYVPWKLAQVMGGVLAHEGKEGTMIISDPATYCLAPGWTVWHRVVHIPYGETVVFNQNLSHGGHYQLPGEYTPNMAHHALSGVKPKHTDNYPSGRVRYEGKW